MVGQRETEGEVRWYGVDERSEVYVVCRRRVRWWGATKDQRRGEVPRVG